MISLILKIVYLKKCTKLCYNKLFKPTGFEADENPVVETPLGSIQGIWDLTEKGQRYY